MPLWKPSPNAMLPAHIGSSNRGVGYEKNHPCRLAATIKQTIVQ
jgi:hypothetical protein